MKNILILAPDFPFPPNHGGRLDVYRIIDKLIEFGNSVDLVSTTNHKEIDYSLVKLDLNNLYVIPRNLSFLLSDASRSSCLNAVISSGL